MSTIYQSSCMQHITMQDNLLYVDKDILVSMEYVYVMSSPFTFLIYMYLYLLII